MAKALFVSEPHPALLWWRRERMFMLAIGVALFACAAALPFPNLARWLGFGLAAYSAVANDSLQTIGTFIASNERQPWWRLWLFIGGIFFCTALYSWVNYGGDVSYGRLSSKGFNETPHSFSYLQLAAPIGLLILTRFRMPVSTTFLLLTAMATSASSVGSVITKSLSGYVIAFISAFVLYVALSKLLDKVLRGNASSLVDMGSVDNQRHALVRVDHARRRQRRGLLATFAQLSRVLGVRRHYHRRTRMAFHQTRLSRARGDQRKDRRCRRTRRNDDRLYLRDHPLRVQNIL